MEKEEFNKAKQSAEDKLNVIAKDIIRSNEWNGKEVLSRLQKELTHNEMIIISGDTLYKRIIAIRMLHNKNQMKKDIAFQ